MFTILHLALKGQSTIVDETTSKQFDIMLDILLRYGGPWNYPLHNTSKPSWNQPDISIVKITYLRNIFMNILKHVLPIVCPSISPNLFSLISSYASDGWRS